MDVSLPINTASASAWPIIDVPHVVILEQPMPSVRYRYKSERLDSKICGVNTTGTDETYPTIQIVGVTGEAVVLVSCVTKDPPYRPHPHCLVGEDCRLGIFQKRISLASSTVISIPGLKIQSTLRKEMVSVLKQRKDRNIDPFQTGFYHPHKIDLDNVRLCFQVILEGNTPGRFDRNLIPVVSEPIHNKKVVDTLNIIKLSDASAPVTGGKEIMLFCDKVCKDDIKVRFFEEESNWAADANFQASDVHRGYGISFRTPMYKTLQVEEPVNVFLQLVKPSDGTVGEALPFTLLPQDSHQDMLRRKKQKYNGVSFPYFPWANTMPPASMVPRPNCELQSLAHEQPNARVSGCASGGLWGPSRSNSGLIQQSLQDEVHHTENSMLGMERITSLQTYSVVKESSDHLPFVSPSEMMHLEPAEILNLGPPAQNQQVSTRMDTEAKLVKIISELDGCLQPFIGNGPQLLSDPQNATNETLLPAASGTECTSLKVSSLERDLDTDELMSLKEASENNPDLLGDDIFQQYTKSEMDTLG